jgi:hypothetical protein
MRTATTMFLRECESMDAAQEDEEDMMLVDNGR